MPRHRFDPSALISGLLFAGLAAFFLAAAFSGREISVVWILPCVLIGLGVVGILRIAFRSRRRDP